MKIIVITQKDYFFIPTNIDLIAREFNESSVRLIIEIDSKGSIHNKKSLFIRGFGLSQTKRYASKVFKRILFGKFDDILFNNKFFKGLFSIELIAKKHKIQYVRTNNIHSKKIISLIEDIVPDIIVSYSAPVVFKDKLLSIPRLGCINLHCSMLPKYSGLFPSFWTLYNQESATGATVHLMDNKIDNGKIIIQQKIPISNNDTIFSLLTRTKLTGGNLMVKALKMFKANEITYQENEVDEEYYFTWPTLLQIQEFRKNGGKLV